MSNQKPVTSPPWQSETGQGNQKWEKISYLVTVNWCLVSSEGSEGKCS